MKKQNVRTLVLIVSTFTYLVIGAAVFDALESHHEIEEKARLKVMEEFFKDKYNISDDDYRNLSRNAILSQPHKAGVQWKFAGSFFFATTVITTIGYGHSTPQTVGGKVFCMLYALAGIPLNLVMFQSIGERLNIFVTYLLRRLKKCLHRKSTEISQTHLIIISMNVSTLVVLGGAWVFSHFEGWSYLDSFYYCIITLTTVGFGDLVPLQQGNALQESPQYVVLGIVFILCGLAVVSAAMNLLVLRFLTMNTIDERRDELHAVALRSSVRLDGDVITINGSVSSVLHQPPTFYRPEDLPHYLSALPSTVPYRHSRGPSLVSKVFHGLCCCLRGRSRTPGSKSRYSVTRSPVTKVTHLLEPPKVIITDFDRRSTTSAILTPDYMDQNHLADQHGGLNKSWNLYEQNGGLNMNGFIKTSRGSLASQRRTSI